MEEQENTSMDGAPLNFAFKFLLDLSELMNERDRAYLNNEIGTYYKTLDRIYTRIYFKLVKNKEDLKALQSKFKEAEEMLYDEEKRKDLKKIISLLKEIDLALMVLVDKYSMIFSNVKNPQGLDKVKARYKLK